MKLPRLQGVWAVVTAAALLAGCSGTPVSVGATAQEFDHKSVDWTRGRTITSSASGFQLLLFIPISINSRHERAYAGLEEAAHGDLITDVRIKDSWTYAFVGTIHETTFEATAFPVLLPVLQEGEGE